MAGATLHAASRAVRMRQGCHDRICMLVAGLSAPLVLMPQPKPDMQKPCMHALLTCPFLQGLLEAPAGDGDGDGSGSDGGARSFQQLRELRFLCRDKADHRRYQCGDYCKHRTEGVQGSLALVANFPPACRRSQNEQGHATSSAAAPAAAAGVGTGRAAVAPQVQQRHVQDVAEAAGVGREQLQFGIVCLGCEPVRLQEWRGAPTDWFD